MHELELFCEMTFFDFKLPIYCTAFDGTHAITIESGASQVTIPLS